jgi:hypothetical protein
LHEQIIGLAGRERPGVAVAGNRADDQAGIVAPQPLEIEAELLDGARLEVLDEDVGLRQQRLEERAILRLREIADDVFLDAVDPDDTRSLAVDLLVVVERDVAFLAFVVAQARAGVR